MTVFPQIIDRSLNQAAIFFRDTPTIGAYRVRAASTLDAAYGTANGVTGAGTIALFDVERGGFFRSRSLRRQGHGLMEESTRGQTRAVFDLDELKADAGLPNLIPADNQIAFLRIQSRLPNTVFAGTETEGPILILQNPGWFSVPRPALTLSGTAPNLATAAAGGLPPAETLEFRVPAYGDSLIFTNHSTTDAIFLSVGPGIPFMQVDPLQTLSHTSGMKDALLIAASGANPTFSVMISTVAGQR